MNNQQQSQQQKDEWVRMRRVCAWCELVMDPGDEGAPTTHGMCDACYAREKAEAQKEAQARHANPPGW